jgi:hypothetical protein
VDPVPLARLECEWNALRGPRLEALFRTWARRRPALAQTPTPTRLLSFLREPGRNEDKDALLRALLAEARREPLAARLVLEALLPGLKAQARRLLVQSVEREVVWTLLLASAWERIVTYPLERRPNRIAANIVLDTLRATLAGLREERRWRSELPPEPLPERAAETADASDVDELLAFAVAAHAITTTEAELISATRIDGESLAALASASGTAYNTMKLRRQRAERRLLVFLGYPPVPRGRQRRPSSSDARREATAHPALDSKRASRPPIR